MIRFVLRGWIRSISNRIRDPAIRQSFLSMHYNNRGEAEGLEIGGGDEGGKGNRRCWEGLRKGQEGKEWESILDLFPGRSGSQR